MKKIVSTAILAFISLLGILVYTRNIYNGESYNLLISGMFFLLAYFYYKTDIKKVDKKSKIFSYIISTVLSICLALGSIINLYVWDKPVEIFGFTSTFTIKNTAYCVIGIVGLLIFFNRLFTLLLSNINKVKIFEEKRKMSWKAMFMVFGIIMLGHFLIYIRSYPALMTPDSHYVIHYANNFILSDLHTFGHTWFVGAFLHLGKFLFNGNLMLSVALAAIVQMLCMASIFTFMIKFLYEKGLNKKICYGFAVFIALSPVISRLSCTLWRDVMFGGSFILLVIALYRMVESEKLKIKDVSLFVLASLIMLYFRNNGIYVFLFMIPFVIYGLKGKRVGTTILMLTIAISYYIVKGPIFDYFGVAQTKSSESFSIPFQQLARVYTLKEKELENEKEFFDKFFIADKISESYAPMISDPIKNISKNDYLKEHKGEFFKKYVELFFRYPQEYFEAYFFQTLGYWYPDTVYWAVPGPSSVPMFEEQVYNQALTSEKYNKIVDFTMNKNIPLTNLLWSVGLPFLVMFVGSCIMIYRKQTKYLVAYVPLFGLWVTIMIATPVFAELRYVYGLICCMPIMLTIPFQYDLKKLLPKKNKK